MANLGFGMYKDQIKDCVLNNIEKLLFIIIGAWIAYTDFSEGKNVWAIIITIVTIVYTILFIFTLKDTIGSIKNYKKVRKEWENYGK